MFQCGSQIEQSVSNNNGKMASGSHLYQSANSITKNSTALKTFQGEGGKVQR